MEDLSTLSCIDSATDTSTWDDRSIKTVLNESCKQIYVDFLNHLSDRIDEMYAFPMTLTHNDFNSRNIYLRDEMEEVRLVVYDWELACYQNPQHDLIEFLAYVLPEKTSKETIDEYAEYYRSRLEEKTGLSFSRREFHRVLYLNAIERGLVRFNLYLLSHNIIKFDFIERVYGNLVNFIISSNAGDGLTA